MNKYCYRLIFSRAHGEVRAVSELARRCHGAPGHGRTRAGPARQWGTQRGAICLLVTAMCHGAALADPIVADSHAAQGQRPEVTATANGVPQVNISAPNQAGLSHNHYQQFDVDPRGAILNNSAVMNATQLAGLINGNPNMKVNSAPAQVILNEVNSAHPSQLRGYLEVAGARAQVIVANPAGIVCNGCGTINAGRMTLSTGRPQLNADGSLAGYQVERGVVRILGGGLNGDIRYDTQYVDILARAVEVNAGIWAREGITLIAGRNHISADGSQTTPLANAVSAPELAIDMGQMGGMYSGHIRMIATEAGVGVRNQGGHLQAGQILSVSSEGHLSWQSDGQEVFTHAERDLIFKAKGSIGHHGKLYTGSTLRLESRHGEITQSGTLVAAGDIHLTSDRGIHASGHLLAGSDTLSQPIGEAHLTLKTHGDIRTSGNLLSSRAIKLSGRRVDISQGALTSPRVTLSAKDGGVALQNARVDTGELVIRSEGDIDAQQSTVSAGRWKLAGKNWFNSRSLWSQVGEDEIRIHLTGVLDNTDARIAVCRQDLKAAALNNQRGSLVSLGTAAQQWQFDGTIDNQGGLIAGNGGLTLTGSGLVNQSGTVKSQLSLSVCVDGNIHNQQGYLLAGKQLQLTARQLHNERGQVNASGDLALITDQGLDNQHGRIQAADALSVYTDGDWDNRSGKLQSTGPIHVNVRSLNNAGGTLQSGGELSLETVGDVINQGGTVSARKAVSWQSGTTSWLNNDGGTLSSDGAVSLTGGRLTNRQQGRLLSQQALTLNFSGDLDNQGGTLTSQGTSLLRAANLLNSRGAINALDSLDAQLTGRLDNSSGHIFSHFSQSLTASDIINSQGHLASQQGWTGITHHFDNQGGSLESQHEAVLKADDLNNANGLLQSAANLALHITGSIDNRAGKINVLGQSEVPGAPPAGVALTLDGQSLQNGRGTIESQQQLALRIAAELDNRWGAVRSNGDQQIIADRVDNAQGQFTSHRRISLAAAQLDNAEGRIISDGNGSYRLKTLNNQQGRVHSGDSLTLNVSRVHNQAGSIQSTRGLSVNATELDNSGRGMINSGAQCGIDAARLNNRDGGLLLGTGPAVLSVSDLDNRAGRLQSAASLDLQGLSILDNRHGVILSNGALTLNSDVAAIDNTLTLLNQDGLIQSGDTLNLNANSLNNYGGTVLSQQAMTLALQHDYSQRAGDHLSSNQQLLLSVAGTLNNLTDWLLPCALTVNCLHFTNQGALAAKVLHLTTGRLFNPGRLEADSMTLEVDTLDNPQTVIGNDIKVNGRIIDNRGSEALIAATRQIDLHARERLTHRDSAHIYSADRLRLSSDDLIENRASTIQAEGDITLAARRLDCLREGLVIHRDAEKRDYKWHRYHYYWRDYGSRVNQDKNTMLPTTQLMTFRNEQAAQNNRYGTLMAIDAAGKRALVRVKNKRRRMTELWVNYQALAPDEQGGYAMTFYETRGFRQRSVPTPYHNTVWRQFKRWRTELWDRSQHVDIASAPFITDYNNFRERTTTGTVTRDALIAEGTGAHTLAGGNIVLRITDNLFNDASTILANGHLHSQGKGAVNNQGYSVNQRRQEYIVDHYDKDTVHWHPTFHRDETTALRSIDGIISGNGNVSIIGSSITNTTVNQAQISSVEAALRAVDEERAEWQRNPLAFNVQGVDRPQGDTVFCLDRPLLPAELALTAMQHLSRVSIAIPNNGLFRQQLAFNAPYLVETDPRFTHYSKFISSDYQLAQVGYDPARVHKRLGDGFYEQRLVREQLLKLTGRPSPGGEDMMALYQQLMISGAAVAQDFHLVPGVALTAEHIARLRQDIVWLVSETVETNNGPQQVWLPKVYLAPGTLRLAGEGAVIAGGKLQLSGESISNAGNLLAQQALTLDAGEFEHLGGQIKADIVDVQADRLTLSTNLQNALRQATLSAGDLRLGGGDIHLQGAKLDATRYLGLSARNTLAMKAATSAHTAGVEIMAGDLGNRTGHLMPSAGKRLVQVQGDCQQALGSQINAGADLNVLAGGDIFLQGSQASTAGRLNMQAGGDVKLLAQTTTNRSQFRAKGPMSSVSYQRQDDRLLLSTLSADQGAALAAGHRLQPAIACRRKARRSTAARGASLSGRRM